MDVTLLVLLILLNGVFAMSEGREPGAQAAMELHDNPTRFLSTVQIGITSIGVLNGIVGEAAFAEPFSQWLVQVLGLEPRTASFGATALVVMVITILTIIFGELVPKRLGQLYPEPIARLVARPMKGLSSATRPLVALLSLCTEGVLRVLGIRADTTRSVTEEEIAASLEEGVDAGVIEAQEHQMVRNVFRLDDRQIGSMMIPRAEIVWLEEAEPVATWLQTVAEHGHTRYPVCRGSLDDVRGVLNVASLLQPLAAGGPLDVTPHLKAPVFVPETLSGMELLENFRASGTDLVFVVDEYGAVQGVITERDLLEAITGEFGTPADEDAWAVRRPEGGWLMDGLIPVPELKDRLELKELPEEDRGRYNTLAGMIMLLLGRLPRTADTVQWLGWRFEVVDLDGKRVDKVLVTRTETPGEET
jgi:putative hemolysin